MKANSRQAFTIVCVLIAVATFVLPVSVFAVTTINQYSVYGVNGVQIGGSSTVNGLVGAQNVYPSTPNGIWLNGGAITIGDARCGTNVNLQNNAQITGTLYLPVAASLTTNSGDVIGAVVRGNPDLPIFPSPSIYSAGTSNVTTTTTPLAPGSYGSVSYGNGGDLKLTAGTYFMASLTLSGTTQVHLDTTGGPISVYIVGSVTMNNRTAIVTGSNSLFWEVHGDWTQGGGSDWTGTLFVPNGTAHIGSGSGVTDYRGQIWASSVDIQHGVTVQVIPEPSTIVLAALGLLSLVTITRKAVRR
jgi:hypothetical protein